MSNGTVATLLAMARTHLSLSSTVETLFYRRGNVIRGEDGDDIFDSIDLAKKKSTSLQLANGGLGRGSLVVVPKDQLFPRTKDIKKVLVVTSKHPTSLNKLVRLSKGILDICQ